MLKQNNIATKHCEVRDHNVLGQSSQCKESLAHYN